MPWVSDQHHVFQMQHILSTITMCCITGFAVTVNGDLSYENASTALQDKKETIRGAYSVIDQLSRTHLNTLERLIFHLVR